MSLEQSRDDTVSLTRLTSARLEKKFRLQANLVTVQCVAETCGLGGPLLPKLRLEKHRALDDIGRRILTHVALLAGVLSEVGAQAEVFVVLIRLAKVIDATASVPKLAKLEIELLFEVTSLMQRLVLLTLAAPASRTCTGLAIYGAQARVRVNFRDLVVGISIPELLEQASRTL